jgi:serine/threonine-protein kinase
LTDTVDRLRAGLGARYRIERELGRGGMATVYLAEDLTHHRPVAVKVLRPELSAALGPERFLHEIDVAAHLQHPHILPLFDSGRLDDGPGVFYYVMPYVEGESLRARMDREKQLPLEDAVRLAGEVADGLDAAHARGVVHRDIKPENILLTGGHAVIADFGLARALNAAGAERLTRSGMALGTPYYMSPEQATAGEVDARADVYSLGCVLYEMLAGSPPFTGPTASAVLARHSVDPVPAIRTVRSSVPEPVERVVIRSLAKVPADRYATARQFARALSEAAAAPRGGSPAPQRPRGLHIALGAVAVAAAAAVWWSDRRPDLAGMGRSAPAASPAPDRIAILSFASLSPDADDAYLARGLSEEIAARLSEVPELTVASRSSVQRLESDTSDVLARARALGLGSLVEGSVRRAGQRVRVSVRLVEAAAGARRWSRSYDRASTDLLAMQDEIALDVARAVTGQVRAGTVPRRVGPGPGADAYDQLLRGNHYLAQRNPRGLTRAVEAYTEATRIDPDFARAFARLAHAHTLFLDWGWSYGGLPAESLLARGLRAAERAVQLDSTMADAWLARGALLGHGSAGRLEDAREAVQRAVDLEPGNAEAHHELGMTLRLLDEDSGAAAMFHRALAIEPDRPMSMVHLAWIEMARRRYTESRRWLDSAAAVNPGFFQAYAERAALRLAVGDTAGARSDAGTAVRLRPVSEVLVGEDVLAALDFRGGDTAAARARVARLRPDEPKSAEAGVHWAAAWASLLVAAGEPARAIAFLEGSRVPRAHLRMHLKEPKFDLLRREERFQRLMTSWSARESPRGSP